MRILSLTLPLLLAVIFSYYHASPSDHIGDLISQALWAPHPLGQPITGTHETLNSINRSHLFQFCQRHHFRDDIVIAAAGPYSPSEFAAALIPFIPKQSSGRPESTIPFVYSGKSTPVVLHRDTEQLQLAIAFHTTGRHHSSRHALRLLSILLGESTSSRLFQQLREERGLCYHISSDLALFEDTGSLEISAGLDPDSREEAMKAIYRELTQLATEGPSHEELERAKKIAITAHKIALESTGAHMSWIAESILFEGKIVTPAESRARLLPVTPGDIQKIASMIFSPTNQAIAEIRAI